MIRLVSAMPDAVISTNGAKDATIPACPELSGEDGSGEDGSVEGGKCERDTVFISATLRFHGSKSTLYALALCGFLSLCIVMKHLLAITDPVRLTYLESLLKAAGVMFVVQDRHISDLMAGSNTLFPMRIMVAEDHLAQAKRVLSEAGQYYDD